MRLDNGFLISGRSKRMISDRSKLFTIKPGSIVNCLRVSNSLKLNVTRARNRDFHRPIDQETRSMLNADMTGLELQEYPTTRSV